MAKYGRLWLLIFLTCSCQWAPKSCVVQAEESDCDISDNTDSEGEDTIIEKNPHYMEDSDSDTYDETSDEGDHDSDEKMDEGKTALNKAMSRPQKGKLRYGRFLKKKRTEITICLLLFAFRRELLHLMQNILFKTGPDGEKKIRRISVSPTSILKIVLFIDLMRKMQSSTHDGPPSSLPTSSFLSGGIMSKFHEVNSAYLPPVEQHYTFERVNDRYRRDRMAFQKAVSEHRQTSLTSILGARKNVFPSSRGNNDKTESKDAMASSEGASSLGSANATAIVLDFNLDTSVSQIDVIRDSVSFILQTHRGNREDAQSKANTTVSDKNITLPELEVIVLLESPGGSASDYGLGASQMSRLRDEPGITLTVCVDKVAASGGYMMACVAHRLCCAHFAVVGSIGVIGQALNIHNTLQNWGVRPLVFRGGKDKAPVGMIGEVTKEGIAKVQNMVDKTHEAFKRHVVSARPEMAKNIEELATGDVYLGCDAINAGLVDRLVTSDEYIGEKLRDGVKVLKLLKNTRRSLHLFGSTPGRRSPFLECVADFKRVLSSVADILEDLRGEGKRSSLSPGVIMPMMLSKQKEKTNAIS